MDFYFKTAFALFLSSFVMGFSGFGFSMTAISILCLFQPLKEAVPVVFFLNSALNTILILQLRHYLDWKRVLPQAAGFAPGAIIGLFFLTNVNDELLKLGVGATLLLFALWSFLNVRVSIEGEKRPWSLLSGFLGGILGGAAYMPGPPVIIYNTWAHTDRFRFKVDLQVFFLLTNIYFFFTYAYLGLISFDSFLSAASFSPFVLLGVLAGVVTCNRTTNRSFSKIGYVLISAMGILLMIKSLV